MAVKYMYMYPSVLGYSCDKPNETALRSQD